MRLVVITSIFLMACASVQPLSGGDKDEIPPKVLRVSPDSASTNVNTQTFVFQFDEYVKTTKVNDLLLISPNQKTNPKLTIKGKKVILTLQDSLLSNTTYTFQFNGSIIDNNEGNPLANYRYVFSTGEALDSLIHSGIVRMSETNKPCKSCNVQLYRSTNDSVILKSKPNYLAKTDEAGMFRFFNLPADSFKRIVLADENKNLTLDKEESVSLSKYIHTLDSLQDTAYVFPLLNKDKLKASLVKSAPGKIVINFNKPTSDTINLLVNNARNNYTLSPTRDTITASYTPKTDTTYIIINHSSDTLDLKYILDLDKLDYNLKTLVKSHKPLILETRTSLSSIDSSKIKLKTDSLDIIVNKIEYIDNKLILTPSVSKDEYTVYLDKGALTDVFNKTNLPDTLRSIKTEITSTTLIKLEIVKEQNYLVYLMKDDKLLKRQSLSSSKDIAYNNLTPGNYRLKIITDSNGNGIWDTGDLFTGKEPEAIQFSEPFEVRENWDKELTIKVL